MSARIVDVLMFIPLILVISPIGLLPWERWVPSKIAGPYLLYCAFAIWHFKHSWWAVLVFGSMGVITCFAATVDLRKSRTLKRERESKTRILQQAQNWPIAEGSIFYVSHNLDADGVRRVTLRYTYKVHDEQFVGSDSFEVMTIDDAERYESRCRGRRVNVHYQKDKPEICTLDRDGMQ